MEDKSRKPAGPPVQFLCDRCAETIRQNGTRLFALTDLEPGVCELGRFRHGGGPVAGRLYELDTPQAREAAHRRRARERRGPEVRTAQGGGERRRASEWRENGYDLA